MLVTMLMLGTSAANAGIIFQGFNEAPTNTEQCTEPVETKMDWGIIFQGLTGIVQTIVQNVADDEPVNCGIIFQG
jgi:hypothetical protein